MRPRSDTSGVTVTGPFLPVSPLNQPETSRVTRVTRVHPIHAHKKTNLFYLNSDTHTLSSITSSLPGSVTTVTPVTSLIYQPFSSDTSKSGGVTPVTRVVGSPRSVGSGSGAQRLVPDGSSYGVRRRKSVSMRLQRGRGVRWTRTDGDPGFPNPSVYEANHRGWPASAWGRGPRHAQPVAHPSGAGCPQLVVLNFDPRLLRPVRERP